MLNRLSTQTGILFFFGIAMVISLHAWKDYSEDVKQLPQLTESEAIEITELIAASISNHLLYQRPFQIWKQLDTTQKRFADNPGMRISGYAVLDHQGMILTHSNPIAHPIMTRMQIPTSGANWYQRTIEISQTVQHPSDGHTIGYISVTFDASFIDASIEKLTDEMLLPLLLALLITIILSVGIAYRISTPLNRLTNISSRIGSGTIDVSDFSGKPSEIIDLAKAIARADQSIDENGKELAKNQQLLSAVLNHSPAVIFIKDLDGRYILVNERFEQLFHVSNEAIKGKTGEEIFAPEIAEKLREHDRKVLANRQAMVLEEHVPDDRGMREYYALKSPLYDKNGDIYAICGIATDVTEQKANSTRISKLATAIEQTDEIVVITDIDGIIEYVNPAFERVSGYSRDEAIGQKPSLVKSGVHSDKYYASMWQILLQGKTWRGDFTNRNKQGEQYEVTQSITPILDENSEIIGFSSVQLDVTEQRKLQQRMQHADRVDSLGVLAGGIAHDFNNLLTAILGNASLALRKLDNASPALKYITSIENASHSAADLCKQMLAYSGKGKFVVKSINLSALVEGMVKLIEVSLAKNVVIKYNLTQSLPSIDADIAQIQQVVLNLITNASEAIEGKSGVISISTGAMQVDNDYLNGCVNGASIEPGRYIFLEVSDTGCGMDAETQKRIFDPFFTTKFAGRGLGMSAMLGIVRGHKGGLRIYSEPGQGTTIKISFPISNENNTFEADIETHSHMQWNGSGAALIIDDEESIREVASDMLEEMGFKVITACDGEQGLEIFRERCSDIALVLLDMTMPKMNGQECFQELRRIDPAVRVLLSSGYNEQDATNRFAGKGLAGFIQKPYSSDQLSEKLQSIFG